MNRERLSKELHDLKKNYIPNVSAGPLNSNNIFNWGANIIGPEGTPYEGGVFNLDIT